MPCSATSSFPRKDKTSSSQFISNTSIKDFTFTLVLAFTIFCYILPSFLPSPMTCLPSSADSSLPPAPSDRDSRWASLAAPMADLGPRLASADVDPPSHGGVVGFRPVSFKVSLSSP